MTLLSILLLAAATSGPPDVDLCMRAAAAAAHSDINDIDHEGCVCTVQQLHKLLAPGDYDLHAKMEAIIASGAIEKSFNAQLSDIMKKRGMTQLDATAFLTRAHAAESHAAEVCNPPAPAGH